MDDLVETRDPLALCASWFERAQATEPADPTRFTLATVGPDGSPSVRFLLLKSIDARGFGFVTHHNSRKGRELTADPRAALAVHWSSVDVQVRAEGRVEWADDALSDAYFASRPRESQLGAWASPQSQPIASRQVLLDRLAEAATRFEGVDVPRPPTWGYGFLVPSAVELWFGQPSRLHDRFRFERGPDGFRGVRLSP